MTEHRHTELVDGCYRCDLNRDEIEHARHWDALERAIDKAIAKSRHVEDHAIDAAEALLHSTDPAVLDAMQDALVRAGRLTVETDGRVVVISKHYPHGPKDYHAHCPACNPLPEDTAFHQRRRLVTEWTEAGVN